MMLNSRLGDNGITLSCLLHSQIIDYQSLEARLISSLASDIGLHVLYRRSELGPQRPCHRPPKDLHVHMREVAVEPDLFHR